MEKIEPNDIKEFLEEIFETKLELRFSHDLRQKREDLEKFKKMINIYEAFFIKTTVLFENFGIDLTVFSSDIQDLHEILFKKLYGNIGHEVIYNFVTKRGHISLKNPLICGKYKISDVEQLYLFLEDLKNKNG